MKLLRATAVLALTLLSALACKAETQEPADVLHLRGSGRLTGRFGGFRNGRVIWAGGALRRPIHIRTEAVSTVEFGRRGLPQHMDARVQLSNGDWLAGKSLELDDQQLALQTDWAGKLTIPRAFISRIQPENAFVKGLQVGALSDWIRNSGEWSIRAGVIRGAKGALSREFDLTDEMELDLTVGWKQQPDFSIIIYTNPYRYQSLGYNCYFKANRISLNMGTRRRFGRPHHWDVPRDKKARVHIRANRKGGAVTVSVNGRKVNTWYTGYQSRGSGITLCANPQQPHTFESFTLLCRGRAARLPMAVEGAAQLDLLHYGRDSHISGRLLRIKDETTVFETDYGRLKVPTTDVGIIALAARDRARARRRKDDVELQFAAGLRLTVGLIEIDADTVTAESEHFGRVKMRLPVFERIRFNIYRAEAD